MAITESVSQVYTISDIQVGVDPPFLDVTFSRVIGGSNIGGPTMHIAGADLFAIFGANPDATKTRSQDLNDALYAYAISSGTLTGVIG